MALGTYAQLKTSISAYLASGTLYDSQIPDFITLFESAANRKLRVRQQETTTTLTPSSGSATLPSDYLTWRRATWTGTPNIDLEFVHPSYMTMLYPTTVDERPKNFTIEGLTLKTGSNEATGITFAYFQKIPALSDVATTNWLLTAHPDLYLFGSLVEANAFKVMGEHAALWKARRDEIFDEIVKLSEKGKGPSAIRPTGPIP